MNGVTIESCAYAGGGRRPPPCRSIAYDRARWPHLQRARHERDGLMVGLVVMWAGLAALSPGVVTAATGPGPPVESLAVLPFANTCGDAKQDYFADGMTEALITDLAKIHALKVISRVTKYRQPTRQRSTKLLLFATTTGCTFAAGDTP